MVEGTPRVPLDFIRTPVFCHRLLLTVCDQVNVRAGLLPKSCDLWYRGKQCIFVRREVDGNFMDKDRTFFGTIVNDRAKTPVWYGFDASWYRRRYMRRLAEMGEALDDRHLSENWQADEGGDGTSPNRFFDEEWYLQNYPDVRRSVQEKGIFRSGFQHYVDVGCQSCAGHWLFSADYYLGKNPDYGLRAIRNAGFVNSYDHFICIGDRQFRAPHPFFDPELFIRECLNRDLPFDPSQGALAQYLSLEHAEMGMVRTSWYFDPLWYLSQYPDVAEAIEAGTFISPLHHYMSHAGVETYSPNPYFDENYYLSSYPDVRDAINRKVFRNGYDHFIRAGINELRNPSAELDMAGFVAGLNIPDILRQTGVDNPFLLWVLRQEGRISEPPPAASVTAANALALRNVEAALPSLFRQPLRFDEQRHPPLSVVLFSKGNYLLDIATLMSLHAQNVPGMQVIVASTGNALSRRRLRQAVEGIEYFFTEEVLPPVQQLRRIMPLIRGERILLLEAGIQLLPMALSFAMASMTREVAGGSGKLLTATNRVLEAGSAVWRDGSVTFCGQGEKAQSQSVRFQRIMEAVQGGLLFCQHDGLANALHYLDREAGDALFTCLSIALRATGRTLFYWPAVQARVLDATFESYSARTISPTALRRIFPSFLPIHAIAQGDARTGNSYRPGVMMVFPRLPRLLEGGAVRRIMQQIDAFRALGWRVLVIGLERGDEDRLVIYHDYPADVECWQGIRDFPSFLRDRKADTKLLWLGGTDMLARLGPVLASGEFSFRDKAIVLDIVSQDGTALKAMETHLRRLVGVVDEPDLLMQEARGELEYAWLCQGIVTGDELEAALLRKLGCGNVMYLPYAVFPRQELTVKEQDNEPQQRVLFPLSIYRAGDAGHDGFDWFCLSVMPYLRRHFGEELPVCVGGYHHPQVDLGFYERLAPLDGLARMDSFAKILRQSRILVVPARVFATQATEVLEAAGQGVPAILSTPQMERLGWKDGREALDGGFNDPEQFAQQLIRLHEDIDLWNRIRNGAYEHVRKHHGYERFQAVFSQFVDMLFAGPSQMERPLRDERAPSRHAFAPAPLRVLLKPVGEPQPAVVDQDEAFGEDDEDEDNFMPLPTRLGVTLPKEYDDQKDETVDE